VDMHLVVEQEVPSRHGEPSRATWLPRQEARRTSDLYPGYLWDELWNSPRLA
jgi:hypothetical protein